MAAASTTSHPASIKRVAAAFRKPWNEQCGRPASLQRSRNQFPNPAAVKGAPSSVTRKVRCLLRVALNRRDVASQGSLADPFGSLTARRRLGASVRLGGPTNPQRAFRCARRPCSRILDHPLGWFHLRAPGCEAAVPVASAFSMPAAISLSFRSNSSFHSGNVECRMLLLGFCPESWSI
jgi:hypothetical protein